MSVKAVSLRVKGDYACFSRPEFKVERISYPLITPSAARGCLEAVFWKPEFRYEIRRIDVIDLGGETSFLRNELAERQGERPVFVEDMRQQRTSSVLKDVDYVIHAEMVLKSHATDPVIKYYEQFHRNAGRGRCRYTPYLGTREFAADFELPPQDLKPQSLDEDFGLMLFEIAYVPSESRRELEFVRHGPSGPIRTWGYAQPLFFEARLSGGTMYVPPELYLELRRLEGNTHA